MRDKCIPIKKLSNKRLDKVKRQILSKSTNKNVYFKDQVVQDKREVCFRGKPYDRDEVNPYSSDSTITGLRRLGVQVIGIGKLK